MTAFIDTVTRTKCAGCHAEVRVGHWTARSERTGKVLCDDCAVVPLSATIYGERPRFEARAVLAPARTPDLGRVPDLGFDACVRCRDAIFVLATTARSVRSGAPVCDACARSGRIEVRTQAPAHAVDQARAYVDGVLERRAALTHEERAELAVLEERMRSGMSFADAAADAEYRAARQADYDEMLRSVAELAEGADDVGPTMTPGGMWMVRTAEGVGFYADFAVAEDRAAYWDYTSAEFRDLREAGEWR